MKNKLNIGSFLLSIICLLVFFIVSTSGPTDSSLLGIHPLNLLLYILLFNFFLGLLGFSGIHDWKGMVRSVTTIILTLGLIVFLTFVIFIGNLFN